MKVVDYTDEQGAKWRVRVPDDMAPDEYHEGIPIGPPDIIETMMQRGWNEEAAIRLHNALFDRGIITKKDVLRIRDVQAALMAALKTDAQTIQTLYLLGG